MGFEAIGSEKGRRLVVAMFLDAVCLSPNHLTYLGLSLKELLDGEGLEQSTSALSEQGRTPVENPIYEKPALLHN